MAIVLLRSTTEAVRLLARGNIVAYPTETSYALGADATNVRAITAVYHLKRRQARKPLSIIVSSRAMAERYVWFSALSRRFAKQHWPGPLTLVLPAKRRQFADRLGASSGQVAVRVSSHPVARQLSHRLGKPIVATSANVSGRGDCYTIRDLRRSFGAWVAPVYLLSAGALRRRKSSTVVRVSGATLTVLRQGPVHLSSVGRYSPIKISPR